MQKFISADWIFPVNSAPIQNGIIAVATDGEIRGVFTADEALARSISAHEVYKGVLVPGFVNTHCHLELSHMKNRIAEKTGLPNFIRAILANRVQPESEMLQAMALADEEMYNNGIVAVGDISNLLLSKSIKLKSKIYYHTFVEVFGFNRPAQPIIEAGLQLKQQFEPLHASIVPHAPYSVSPSLFREIEEVTTSTAVLSIHNQETKGENELFESGTGNFADFLAELGITQSEAHATNRRSIEYHLPLMPKNNNTLLVHNTMTVQNDVAFAQRIHQRLFWCLCPNANRYIENSLPDVKMLRNAGATITIGTDSLASNHQLNILAELQTLQDEAGIPFREALTWATLNGATFLGVDHTLGSLEPGKRPGVLLLDLDSELKVGHHTKIKRLY